MLIKVISGLLILSFIVVIHELGHCIFAKRAGIFVEEFCIGMGPKLVQKKWGETNYAIRLFPIGGACMMKGEDEEVENCDDSFGSKSVWQRIAVVAAGPIFNFILAFFVAFLLISFSGINNNVVTNVAENSAAYKAGIKPGDKIVAINGSNTLMFKDVALSLFDRGDKASTFKIETNGEIRELTITPDMNGNIPVLGVVKSPEKEKVGFFQTFKYAGHEVKYWIKSVFVSLKKIFTGNVSRDQVAGPLGIVNLIGSKVSQSASNGFGALLESIGFFIVLISANLGVMNLLPFPALDGGRLIFLFVELITGKRLPQKVESYINLAGFVALMGLMVFLFYNDIINLIK